MNVTVNETNNVTQVTETFSSVLVSETSPSITVIEDATSVTVQELSTKTEVIEVGNSISVYVGTLTIVEVQSPGPKGDPAISEKGPAFTYSGGLVSRIDYDSGAYKTLAFSGGKLSQVDYIKDGATIRKVFVYDNSGKLTEIIQTSL
jgi:hypothetical protein